MRRFPFALLMIMFMVGSAKAATYQNPIISEDAPDPSIIRGNDGYYYLFSTAEHVYRSKNMTSWTYMGQVFDGGVRPTFVEGVSVYWAPCVTKQNGRYVMYFALSKWGGGDTASIGVATADNPQGPYSIVGDGKLFTSSEVGVNNSIDPNYIEVNGRKYVVWGSWNGIWLIELTADGLAVKNINVKRQIAGTRFEAPYIYKRGKYYYLFCSIGACCEGENSTYETVVGRSTSVFGPYTTKDGKGMMDNAYELFLTSNEPCIAPGHNSRIIEDEEGRTWMTYHGYMRSDPDRGRVVWLDEVKWKGGWPYIEGKGASSEKLDAPVVSPYSLDVDEVYEEWGARRGTLIPVDLFGDGRMNMLVAGEQEDKTEMIVPWNTVLRRNAEGKWEKTECCIQTGLDPNVTPADFDGDGRLELLVLGKAHETTSPHGAGNGIYVPTEEGVFQKADVTLYGASFTELTAATVADVNRDGRPDIIAVGPQGRNVVLRAIGDWTFQTGTFADTSIAYTQVATADFNADGVTDLFAYSTTAAELFLGDGYGNFSPTNWRLACPVPTDGGVAIADVNDDSALDIVCTTTEGAVRCLNDGTAHFTVGNPLKTIFLNDYCAVGTAQLFDWNGDRYPDFFYQGKHDGLGVTTGGLWMGNNGVFSHKFRYGTGAEAVTAFLDWNGDGATDLVTLGNTTDDHLFPFMKGNLLSVSLNPNNASRGTAMPTQLESLVEGNVVTLSWKRGAASSTYEVYVRDEAGRLLGNVRAYIDGELNGQRKVMALGNCGTAIKTQLVLPSGHYTWGVQGVNTQFVGSTFATGEFTISTDGITELPSTTRTQQTFYYNLLGQRVSANHRGFQLIRYSDGRVRKLLGVSVLTKD